MKQLDETKTYYLADLTEEQWDLLKPILNQNSYRKFKYDTLKGNFTDGYMYLYFNENNNWALKHYNDVTEPITNALELFKEENKSGWLKHESGSLYYITSECKNGHLYGYGFNTKGWFYCVDKRGNYCVLNSVAKKYTTPATNEEVEQRLIDYAKSIGFSGNLYFNPKRNTFWNHDVEIMHDGIWSESFKEESDKPIQYAHGIDTFERMEVNCTKEECLAFAKGNIDKYNWRTKGQDKEDFEKIINYAKWALKLLNK